VWRLIATPPERADTTEADRPKFGAPSLYSVPWRETIEGCYDRQRHCEGDRRRSFPHVHNAWPGLMESVLYHTYRQRPRRRSRKVTERAALCRCSIAPHRWTATAVG